MAKILMVDDSRTSKKMLRGILEESGHLVVGEASDGEEGYLKYKELQPDLVTMDITMPKMDGLECLQLIRKYDDKAKVVMITAAGQKEKMIAAIKHGATEFLTKPFDKEEIVKIINKVVE